MNLNARFASVIRACLVLAASASPPLAASDIDPAQVRAGVEAAGPRNAGVPTAPSTPAVKPQSRPDFSGHWVLNDKASDDPQEKVKKAMKQAGGGGPGMRGGGGGMGRGGGGRGGGMGGERQGRGSPERMGGRSGMPSGDMASLIATAKKLDISHEDPMLLIADENDRRQRLFTDFRGASVSVSGGLQQRVAVAGWEGGALVVESRMDHGSKLVQQYRIDAETGQLMISAQLPELQGLAFRLVYDRLKPETDVGSR